MGKCEKNFFIRHNKGPRPYQEDALAVEVKEDKVLLVVADGMGGHSRGDLASRTVVETFLEVFSRDYHKDSVEILKTALKEAFNRIKSMGSDMGTTLVAAIIEKRSEKKYSLYYTWIGDSRLYVFTPVPHSLCTQGDCKITPLSHGKDKSPRLFLLTRDDSLIWALYEQKQISIDDIARHPAKNQLQYSLHPQLSNIPVRINQVQLQENDMVFLCTDGVWESFASHTQFAEILAYEDLCTVHEKLSSLLENAIKQGKCDDNNTYIIVRVNHNLFKLESVTKKQFGRKKPVRLTFSQLIVIMLFVLGIAVITFLSLRPLPHLPSFINKWFHSSAPHRVVLEIRKISNNQYEIEKNILNEVLKDFAGLSEGTLVVYDKKGGFPVLKITKDSTRITRITIFNTPGLQKGTSESSKSRQPPDNTVFRTQSRSLSQNDSLIYIGSCRMTSNPPAEKPYIELNLVNQNPHVTFSNYYLVEAVFVDRNGNRHNMKFSKSELSMLKKKFYLTCLSSDFYSVIVHFIPKVKRPPKMKVKLPAESLPYSCKIIEGQRDTIKLPKGSYSVNIKGDFSVVFRGFKEKHN